MGKAMFCLEFPGEVRNLEIPGGFQKSMSSTPLFVFFLEYPIIYSSTTLGIRTLLQVQFLKKIWMDRFCPQAQ